MSELKYLSVYVLTDIHVMALGWRVMSLAWLVSCHVMSCFALLC